ncbi:hypothetical protein K1719_023560 [Acacia pycnantha]|nr:hypothetical protein K1719_023560 [Acacia pycnantha]
MSNGWSDEKFVTLLDLALKTVAWGIVCASLRVGLFNSDSILQEPLLNDDTDVSNALELNKTKGEEHVTPYSNAGIFSILTFSWVGPLIDTGKRKTLNLEDVPQLASCDRVVGAFPAFRNKLEDDCGTLKRVTKLKLVESLILSSWKEILATAIVALLNTLTSYVGPFLIGTFVQYLIGKQTFKNEGYVLVGAFLVAKLIECLSHRQWFFRLKQVGIKTRALLVTVVYSKGLTLSCQSKQAFIATVAVMFTNVPFASLQETYQDKLMESKDRRMKATSEILRNMRILKLQGWEMKFLSKVIELRNTEERWLRKYVYTTAITTFVLWGAPAFVSVVTFCTCILIGTPLESGKILSAIATFRMLQEPVYRLPETISMIAQTKVSLDRIASFLRLDDMQSNVIEKIPRGSSNLAIEVADGNFSWDFSSPNTTLKGINLTILQGMRVAVCGTVGSGKSSLISCFLGEMTKISGILRVCGTKAFVAQSPWIQSGKIEENILFGKPMDRERYEKVLEACSLKKDLEILPFGDQTFIGERGINLSGGQKQRIQVARALYQDADIYLFDDPFSAVDAHTGSHLFKECLLGLLSSKTIIYITHQVEFLPAANLILVMKDGEITQSGKYNDLLHLGTDFMELVGAHREALSALDSFDGGEVLDGLSATSKEVNMLGAEVTEENETNKDRQIGKIDNVVEPKGQLIQEEERGKGRVGFSVYWKFITTSFGGALVPFMLLAQILFQVLQIGSNYWMAWATPISPDVKAPVEAFMLITVYVALSIGGSFCILAREILLSTAGFKTATLLFSNMHKCIFHAPMSFFDATPSGRIISRASTDQSVLDTSIPYKCGLFAFSSIQLLGVIVMMSQVAWQVYIIFIPVISMSIWYQQYYLPASQELSRIVGLRKAPIIQHFAETISGTTTIRSFDQESRFQETSMKLVDEYSCPNFNIAGAMEWLCFRLDMLSSITFAFFLIFLIFMSKGVIDPGIAGLAVTYGLNLNLLQVWVMVDLSKMENKITSVERVLQYTCIPSEPPLVIEENRPYPSWPSRGEVDIRDLQVRYVPHLPLVLRGITCKFLGGMKTGIVGRTGSGKTTLIQTLFRIIEPSAGQIVIDGINISSIGLHDLRSRLSIIPQDPTMFEGTALDKCQLGDEVRKKEGKLDSAVSENGENWSMGQRQLVCLGRVLLKRSKVLVLDEATASVDTATDNLIQQTLRKHFSDCTVIAIAHRITSVLDSNMVLLLNQGLIEEHDSPSRLLEDKTSSFAQLVAEYTMRSKSSFE